MNSLLNMIEISPTLNEILKMLDDPYPAAVEDEACSGSPGRCETDFPWQENHGAFSGEDADEIRGLLTKIKCLHNIGTNHPHASANLDSHQLCYPLS
jgi:hypothetical protein